MKTTLKLSAWTAMLLLGSTLLQAQTPAAADPGAQNTPAQQAPRPLKERIQRSDQYGNIYYTHSLKTPKSVVAKEIKYSSEHFKKAPKEVLGGLKATLMALNALQKNDSKTAEANLQKAVELFDQALKADPQLKLVPIDQEIELFQFEGGVKEIKAAIVLAKSLLNGYHTQAARDLLIPLKDEIDITTHFVPMDLYPKAAKDALALLKSGKKEEAIRTLILGLNTIVAAETVIPIPLLTAEDLIRSAAELAKKDPKQAMLHLHLAKVEIHRALLLGYTDTHAKAYKSIYKQLSAIQKEIKAKHETKALFTRVNKDVKSLLEKTRSEQTVRGSLSKAHKAAAQEEESDKERFEEEMQLDAF
ncbi:YfdX family protein [Nitratifractor sp.]